MVEVEERRMLHRVQGGVETVGEKSCKMSEKVQLKR